MAKRQRPPKKGPQMATAYKPRTRGEVPDHNLDAEVDTFLSKLHSTIQDARSKMTDEEAEKADQKAKKILDRATAAAKASRHSA
jgi:hypothetical protein